MVIWMVFMWMLMWSRYHIISHIGRGTQAGISALPHRPASEPPRGPQSMPGSLANAEFCPALSGLGAWPGKIVVSTLVSYPDASGPSRASVVRLYDNACESCRELGSDSSANALSRTVEDANASPDKR
jgi:hypothetical protein